MKAHLANLGASFDRLSKREQHLVLLSGVLLFAAIVGFTGFFISRDLAARERRITAKMAQLEELAGLKIDYQRRLSEQRTLAQQIRDNNPMRLLSYIEETSKRANIELGNAQERSGQSTGSELLKEEAAEVTVKNVSIDRLYDFLKKIEEGNRLVKVRHLKIKRRFDNNKMLDATITVGTFKTTS